MKKVLTALLCMVFISAPVFSQAGNKIKGTVFNAEGKPLPGVRVEILDTPLSTDTLIDGSFNLNKPEKGKIVLRFTHPDYEEHEMTVDSGIRQTQYITVQLVPKNPMFLTIKEEITVTAKADSIIDISLPSHKTILPGSVLTEMGTSNVADSVDKVPGVAAIGKGGYSMSPAVRGLAEHRVLLLMDGVRITSERRVGASASFISLNDIDRIEVNRGPYSVFYGSGAVAGIVNVITKTPPPGSPFQGSAQISYNTAREEKAGSLNIGGSWGKTGYMLDINGKKAEDYSSPEGVVEQSRYSDVNLLFKLNRGDMDSRLNLTFFHYSGMDIGKPSPTARLKPRWYPHEGNTLLTLGYEARNKLFLDTLSASAYVFRSSLETKKENLREDLSVKKRNLAEIEGLNFGFKLRAGKALGKHQTLSFGFDFFGRDGINDSNTEWEIDEAGVITSEIQETSLNDARRSNFGVYVDDKIQALSQLSFNVGVRFDSIHTANRMIPGESYLSRGDESLSAYVGAVLNITPRLSLLANAGRSFRFPSVSELFYSGLTGRGTVFGNPDLDPEKSLNLDTGFRYLHERFYASIYGFSNTVSDFIEKYQGETEEEYYYRNLIEGRIKGLEGEFYFALLKNVELFVNFHLMEGREKETDNPLNYIPPSRITFWGKYSHKFFWFEPKLTLTSAKKDPGPLEQEIDGSVVLDTILGLSIHKDITMMIIFQNLLNQTYFSSADKEGVLAPGRGVVLKVLYRF
ncbi:MAG: TonB-dependent receptor [Candidatus Aminicenantes bacterium]|nr:TonB-dependent receptor [Candidatus Aminicenantes bacterium]